MLTTTSILWLTLTITLTVGILIFLTNSSRLQNRCFLLLALTLAGWCAMVLGIMHARTHLAAQLSISTASYVAALIPLAFHLLCAVIEKPALPLNALLRETRFTLIASQLIGVVCYSPLFLTDIILPGAPGATNTYPEAVYGPGFPAYVIYFIMTFGFIIHRFIGRMRHAPAIQRSEFHFVMLGVATTAFFSVLINLILPLATGISQYQQYGPICIIILNAIIAYGIATQRIMDVGYIIRRSAAYSLLMAYLAGLYLASWFIFNSLMPGRSPGFSIVHLLAALVVALSLAPAHGRMQRFANRLFINTPMLDAERVLQEANKILQSVTRLDALLPKFAELTGRVLGTDRVYVLLRTEGQFRQAYPLPMPGTSPAQCMAETDPVPGLLRESEEPLITGLMVRRRPTERQLIASDALQQLDIAAAAGVSYKEKLEGIILLGPRLSGQIYSANEQDLLKLLGNQLGVAIENAKLYTEVQDGKIYNNILLDNLVNGVAAANRDRTITVFNHEAERITGLEAAQVVGHSIDILPDALKQAIESTLTSRQSIRDRDFTLMREEHTFSVRAGTTAFWGHQGDFLGALIVFSDNTRLKALEEQIRRHDRLASIGTLSAGMAHEIKNPLVSIKTFTELLPTRFDDAEFRDKFTSLVGSEVDRIDRIVNQLLRFARPAKADLAPLSLHGLLKHALNLLDQQLRKKHIKLVTEFAAPHDQIQGDTNLLQQALINFFLNAIDAMEEGGTLTVRTLEDNSADVDQSDFAMKRTIQLMIQDTGVGIPAKDLPHVFDPFFTTKSSGTGLGLAVAHGILDEHHAQVSVESEPGRGTTFTFSFSLDEELVPA